MGDVALVVEPHPALCLRACAVEFAVALADVAVPAGVRARLSPVADLGLAAPDEALRGHIRDLLRYGGFKPTGRSKPSSEYLVRAAAEGKWPNINVVVDAGNVVSLQSGIPISVVDLDRARAPLRVGLAPAGSEFVFNASGQVIDVSGLLGLRDADGPCANAVKDAQRTKTDAATRRALVLLWGHTAVARAVDAAALALGDLLRAAGARVQEVRA